MKKRSEPSVPVYDVVEQDEVFALHRNGRLLMTPKGNAFCVPNKPLAEALTLEWSSQGEKIDASKMPLTQLAATALDIVRKDRTKIINGLLAYIGSELLCHRAQEPEALVQKQNRIWQPVLDWCNRRYDVCFSIGTGIMPIQQSPEVTERLGGVLSSYDDYHLAGLSSATDSSGSLVLGLALAERQYDAEAIYIAAELDTHHQAEKWGEDPVTQARQEKVKADLLACENWFGFLR